MPKRKVVGLEEFKALVRKIAKERPDFYYSDHSDRMMRGWMLGGCFYAPSIRNNGTESRCIIGEALHRLGYSDTMLESIDGWPTPNADKVLLNFGFDAVTARWAQAVQKAQDNGKTWGEAVEVVP